MTTTDLDSAANAYEEEIPPSQDSDAGDEADQAQDENERERVLQRRLTQQGREAAEARRAAAYAQQHAQALAGTVTELHAQVRLLTESMSEQQRQQAVRQQQELEEYLKTLPPEQRLDRKIEILGQQIEQMRQAATPSRPSQPAPQPQPQRQAAPQQQQYTEQDSVEYMRQRAVAIVNEAQNEFGVRVDVSAFDDSAWETEESFYRAVMRTAARESQNGGADVPKKPPANETPQQMQARIRREIEDQLGVSSPNGPKGTPRKQSKPSDDDVKNLVNGYQSAKGPRAQVAKLREMRERMG